MVTTTPVRTSADNGLSVWHQTSSSKPPGRMSNRIKLLTKCWGLFWLLALMAVLFYNSFHSGTLTSSTATVVCVHMQLYASGRHATGHQPLCV